MTLVSFKDIDAQIKTYSIGNLARIEETQGRTHGNGENLTFEVDIEEVALFTYLALTGLVIEGVAVLIKNADAALVIYVLHLRIPTPGIVGQTHAARVEIDVLTAVQIAIHDLRALRNDSVFIGGIVSWLASSAKNACPSINIPRFEASHIVERKGTIDRK